MSRHLVRVRWWVSPFTFWLRYKKKEWIKIFKKKYPFGKITYYDFGIGSIVAENMDKLAQEITGGLFSVPRLIFIHIPDVSRHEDTDFIRHISALLTSAGDDLTVVFLSNHSSTLSEVFAPLHEVTKEEITPSVKSQHAIFLSLMNEKKLIFDNTFSDTLYSYLLNEITDDKLYWIETAILSVAPQSQVTVFDILPRDQFSDDNIFLLAEAAVLGNGKLFRSGTQLISEVSEIEELLVRIDWQFRMVIMAKSAMESNDTTFVPEGVKPFVWKKAQSLAHRIPTLQTLLQRYEKLALLWIDIRKNNKNAFAYWNFYLENIEK